MISVFGLISGNEAKNGKCLYGFMASDMRTPHSGDSNSL